MSSQYKLSPSASERFLECTASLPYNTTFTENEYTLKGNLQHKVASLMLEQKFHQQDHEAEIKALTNPSTPYTGKNPDLKVYWDKECDKTVAEYVTYVEACVKSYQPTTLLFETKVRFVFYGNSLTGIIDCAMVLPNNDVIIIDLKTGRNKVETEDNSQMLLYGYALVQDLYVKTKTMVNSLTISICQSLISNVQSVKYSLNLVYEWYLSKSSRMDEINNNRLVFRPSTKVCKYCQYRNSCAARIKEGVV